MLVEHLSQPEKDPDELLTLLAARGSQGGFPTTLFLPIMREAVVAYRKLHTIVQNKVGALDLLSIERTPSHTV